MSACMLTAALVVPEGTAESLDFDAGHAALEAIENPALLTFDDSDLDIEDAEAILDENGRVDLPLAKKVAGKIIDDLAPALYSQETNLLRVGQYQVFVSGGLSFGDGPTDAAEAIWNAHALPDEVLTAIGFVIDHARTEEDVADG